MIKQLVLAGLVATSGLVGSANVSHAAESLDSKPVIHSNFFKSTHYYSIFDLSQSAGWTQPDTISIDSNEYVEYTFTPNFSFDHGNNHPDPKVRIILKNDWGSIIKTKEFTVKSGQTYNGTLKSSFTNLNENYKIEVQSDNIKQIVKIDANLVIKVK
ncbi:hypothetical protein IC619_012880 [Hazenella sp. IB182353]|uniref:hypothetical protein n=1 Tax=Polycladospora coralii TaxID=2771432 RepID=UPI0017476782|nr:hypothetical protein [Polycladospora coralii]MBS7531388.1 hypothetical protein [Polycladospora coralii]